MIDPMQFVLLTVVIVLTAMVVIIGWQIYQILAEIRRMLEKINTATQSALDLTSNIERSLHGFSGITDGIKSVVKIVNLFRGHTREERNHHAA